MTRLLQISFAFAVLWAGTAGAQSPNPTVDIKFARYLLAEGEYYRAVTEFRRAMFLANPGDAEIQSHAILGIGEALYAGLEYERAGEWVNRNLETLGSFSQEREGAVLMCRAFLRADAGQRLLAVLQDNPNASDVAPYYRSLAYANLGQWQNAHEGLLKVPPENGFHSIAQDQATLALEAVNANWKSPAVAGWLGVIPGIGYFYAKHPQTGVASLIVNSVFIFATYQAFDTDQNVLGGFLAVVAGSWYAGNIYGSVQAARRYNAHVQESIWIKFQY